MESRGVDFFLNPPTPAPRFPAQSRTSFYIESFDGTRLALDLYLPQDAAGHCPGQLPTVLVAARENRRDPHCNTTYAFRLIPYGYAVVVLELRGCGVSFGVNDSFGSEQHCGDIAAAVRWVRRQVWSNGKVGMQGGSNRAYSQLCTVSRDPQLLDAITPVVAVDDFYYNNYPNGVSALPGMCMGTEDTHKMSKEEFLSQNVPVDDDPDGDTAYAAYLQDQYGNNHDFFIRLLLPNMNRDTPNPNYGGEPTNLTLPPLMRMQDLAGKAVRFRQQQFIGQLEAGVLDQLNQYKMFGGHVCIGPWDHVGAIALESDFEEGTLDYVNTYLPWFEASLKNRDEDFLQRPPVTYYVFHAGKGRHWRYADNWPPENARNMVLYLSGKPSGTSGSCNDGSLVLTRPEAQTEQCYRVRTDIAPFPDEEGNSTYRRDHVAWDGDMEPSVDSKGLTYTSLPLWHTYDNEFAGCISVDLWVSCSQPDADFFVYLEEVLPDGTSHYIKDGMMRASHRTRLPHPGWDEMGAAWHPSMTRDVQACLEEGMAQPVLLQFAVDPIAYRMRRGSRLRFTVTCANPTACQHPYDPENLPEIRLYQGGDHASCIRVPFLEQTLNVFNGSVTEQGVTQPGTLYFFEKNIYLASAGRWKKLPRNRPESRYTLENGMARFTAAGFDFSMEGAPEANSVIQRYQGGRPRQQPLPLVHGRTVACVPVVEHDRYLFAPDRKTLKLDVYKTSPSEKAPCIVFIHGYGCKYNEIQCQMARMLEKGYAVICIDLRNYPPNLFPDYVMDVKGSIRYIRAHAAEFGIDPDRIGAYGASLGGNSVLMAALTGDVPELEGHVGGNEEFSSSLQAAVAGYAWVDLLSMGPDIVHETFRDPVLRDKRSNMTDGEESPSAEVIDFAGPGKGLGVLRQYKEDPTIPRNPEWDEILRCAREASPIHRIRPGVPPIALFGGFGEEGVNIACMQSYRTFEKLAECEVPANLFCNTGGQYNDNEETVVAVTHFFERYLGGNRAEHTLVFRAGQNGYWENYAWRPLHKAPVAEEKVLLADGDELGRIIPSMAAAWSGKTVDLYTAQPEGYQTKPFHSYKTVIFVKQGV